LEDKQMISQTLTGLHHVSTLSSNIDQTHHFYRNIMGMRPLIMTVNQDDTSMYHLFYGDGAGTPGSDITIFDMPLASPQRHGNNSVSRTTLRVNGREAMEYWAKRLSEHQISHQDIHERDGRLTMYFADTVDTQLALIDDQGQGPGVAWDESDVPSEFQIRGLGYVELTVPKFEPTDKFLKEVLGLHYDHVFAPREAPFNRVHVYRIGEGGPNAEVHVLVDEELPRARYGSGGVHHVALMVPEGDTIETWAEHFTSLGLTHSGVKDRHYFKSIYVREPNHVLFELATYGPGFEVDGPINGEELSLPPALEPNRIAITLRLKPLNQIIGSAFDN
jgi:glyoxalase family protein